MSHAPGPRWGRPSRLSVPLGASFLARRLTRAQCYVKLAPQIRINWSFRLELEESEVGRPYFLGKLEY